MKKQDEQDYELYPKKDLMERDKAVLLALVEEPIVKTGEKKIEWAYVYLPNKFMVYKIPVKKFRGIERL